MTDNGRMEPDVLVCVLHFMDNASEENCGVTNNNYNARQLIPLLQLIEKNSMVCDISKAGPNSNSNSSNAHKRNCEN